MIFLPFNYKNIAIGLAIFLVPYTSFLKPYNIRQLALFDLYLISISIIILLLVLFTISIFLYYITKLFFKKKFNPVFPIICFGCYLLFQINPLLKLFENTILPNNGAMIISLLTITFFWLVIYFLVLYYKTFSLIFPK